MVKKRKSTSKEEASSKEPKPEPKIEKPPPPPPSSSSSDESDSDSSESEGVKTKKQSEEEEVEEEEEEEEEEELSSSESSSSEEEEEEEDSKLKKIKNLLEPFGKEQLINILKDAATTNPSILSGIIASAESNPVHRKIFVHGLSWDATNETLSAVFKQYGPIEECNVITDKVTGRSKGYGFVLFQTHAGARKALKQPEKKIGSRMAACQLASTGPVQNNNHHHHHQQQKQKQQGSDASLRKLYVANVGAQINPEKLRAFLAKFGEIEDGPLGIDKVTGKFRGYAIFVYKTLEGIKKALEEPVKVFDGVKMQCSVAVEKKSAKNNVAAGGGSNVAATGANAAVVQRNVAMPGLPVTLNQGLADQNLNPGVVFMGQNPVLGVLNPVLGLGGVGPSGMMNQTVLNPPFPGGVLQSLNRVGSHPMNPPMGLSAGFGVQPPINSISPSVVSNYGSQAVVQGMGAYQGPQLGQSSDLGAAVAARPNASVPPHLGR